VTIQSIWNMFVKAREMRDYHERGVPICPVKVMVGSRLTNFMRDSASPTPPTPPNKTALTHLKPGGLS
jgi:hypothetical protein